MIINLNYTAENAARNMSIVTRSNKKHTERLSSGYKINRGADDAAGLAISEKMRAQIRGLKQASYNAQDGISLIQIADGALEESSGMVQRINELSVKASNETLSSVDREYIQEEISQLIKGLNEVADHTEFNSIKLLDGSLDDGGSTVHGIRNMEEVSNDINGAETESAVFSFTTTQVTSGGNTSASYKKLAETLEKQIVPQVVSNIMNTYSAFSYLSGSDIGIGLNIYNKSGSEYAFVNSGWKTGGTAGVVGSKRYQLGININHLSFNPDGTLTTSSREELEASVSHEMVHAFMAEATTYGMMGGDKFPLWFVEGMAQTASGDGGWISALTPTSSNADIKSMLSKIGSGYNPGDGAANYGAGYLASMYLGYMAGTGGTFESRIANGLNKIMAGVIGGNSLDKAIRDNTKYSGLNHFSNNVKNDTEAYDFVRDLVDKTGSGRGGLVSNNLAATDLVADSNEVNSVFKLYPTAAMVENRYSGDYTILSGGGATKAGVGASGGGSVGPSPPSPSPGGITRRGGLGLHIGAQPGDRMIINIAEMSSQALELDTVDVRTSALAEKAIDTCSDALNRILQNRSNLGAYQNRLEHVIANLDNVGENTQVAESNIRDTDMSKEIMKYKASNILLQAVQSMLAQANQSPQGILTLLQ